MEVEAQKATTGNNIRQAQAGLEKAGMTFTGQGIEQLGKQAAIARPGAEGVATPEQQPFGGLFYEGTVNQGNRLVAQSNLNQYNQNVQTLGRSAEDYLGTQGASTLGLGYTPAGVNLSGSLGASQQQRYASTIQQLIDQQKAKTNLTTTNLAQ